MTTMTETSILKISSKLNTTESYLNLVIITMMETLTLVKFSLVSSILKMLGEKKSNVKKWES